LTVGETPAVLSDPTKTGAKTIAGLDKIYWCLEFVEYLEHCKHGRPDASPATKDGKVLKQQKLPPLAQGPFL
jgi:hypothetical protein